VVHTLAFAFAFAFAFDCAFVSGRIGHISCIVRGQRGDGA
jgi:hypothetical protein